MSLVLSRLLVLKDLSYVMSGARTQVSSTLQMPSRLVLVGFIYGRNGMVQISGLHTEDLSPVIIRGTQDFG